MHAVARLALHPLITNIQGSWVKIGPTGRVSLRRLQRYRRHLDERVHFAGRRRLLGQEIPPEDGNADPQIGRTPRQRTTFYRDPAPDRIAASWKAAPLLPVVASLSPPDSVRATSRPRRPAGQGVA